MSISDGPGTRRKASGIAAWRVDSATSPPWEENRWPCFFRWLVPRDLPQSWVDGFLRGLLKLAGKFKVSLAGGDTAQSPGGVLADIVGAGLGAEGQGSAAFGRASG